MILSVYGPAGRFSGCSANQCRSRRWALVGYTNAGKSTLFNRLTGAHVLVDSRMFATLDPTVRHVILPRTGLCF